MILTDLLAAEGHDEHHVAARRFVGALALPTADQPISQFIGPLAIVEDQQDRALWRTQRADETGQRAHGAHFTGGLGREGIAILGTEGRGQSG